MSSFKRKIHLSLLILLPALAILSCGTSGGSDDPPLPVPIVTEFLFETGIDHPGAEMPTTTTTGNEPVIVNLTYDKAARQGGDFSGTVTFTDPDDWTGVTTLIVSIDQDDGYWEFPVTPIQDPLAGNTSVNFSIPMAGNFTPGVFTFYIGLVDADGNVSDYLHKVLIVKALIDLSITSLSPLNGTVDAPLNVVVRAEFSQQVFPDEVTITLSDGVSTVTGRTFMSGNDKAIILIPDTLLNPGTAYSATVVLTVNGASLTNVFTTETPVPLANPADAIGKTFTFEIGQSYIIEPAEGKSLLGQLPVSVLPPTLLKFENVAASTVQIYHTAGMENPMGGTMQNTWVSVFGPSIGGFTDPYFTVGPTTLTIDLSALDFPAIIGMYDIYVSGKFVENSGLIDTVENVSFFAYLDTAEINSVISAVAGATVGAVDVCEMLPICDSQGLIQVLAQGMSGSWEAGVTSMYDMSCTANPSTINAATGGSITVTCTHLLDTAGYQGADITFLSRTGFFTSMNNIGTYDTTGFTCAGTPPTCQVPDASGVVIVTVNVAPDELSAGDPFFHVVGMSSNPAGSISRVAPVAVQ